MQHTYLVFRIWIWEILTLALSLGLIIAIAVILAEYDGKPTTHWNAIINFNAVLAFLSTLLRSMLVLVVTQIISQRKWDWLRGTRRSLTDLQQFENGSRGSYGAFFLIPKVFRRDFITLLAAVVLVLSFLIGPFVQLASRTKPCSFTVPGKNASLPFAHYVPSIGGWVEGGDALGEAAPNDLIVAILSAATSPNGVENQINPTCSSGNCTFNSGDPHIENARDTGLTTYSTSGMCSRCEDISSLISTTYTNQTKYTNHSTVSFTLPNSFSVSYDGVSKSALMKTTSDLDWIGDKINPDFRSSSRWAYANVTFLSALSMNKSNAAVCTLYSCLRTYISSVTNNELTEKLVQSDLMLPDAQSPKPTSGFDRDYDLNANALNNWHYYYTAVKSPCRVENRTYVTSNMSSYSGGTRLSLYSGLEPEGSKDAYENVTAAENCIYRQDPWFVSGTVRILEVQLFQGSCFLEPKSGEDDPFQCISTTYIGAVMVMRALFSNNDDVSFSSITEWFDSFANAMTNRFRSQYGAFHFNKTDTDRPVGQIQGLTWETKVCLSTHWEWLLFPICVTLMTLIASILTIASNWQHRHSVPVWKDSILPLIFYGHRIESQESDALSRLKSEHNGVSDVLNPGNQLLEASEMENIGKDTSIKFRWADSKGKDFGEDGVSSTLTEPQSPDSLTRRKVENDIE